jgi:hypothetical protein
MQFNLYINFRLKVKDACERLLNPEMQKEIDNIKGVSTYLIDMEVVEPSLKTLRTQERRGRASHILINLPEKLHPRIRLHLT